MKYKSSIGIVGLGYVGNAVFESYNFSAFNVKTLDTDPRKNTSHSYSDLMSCEAVFVCVPSPMNSNGSCNSSILEEVLSHFKDYEGVIISKVTALPSVYRKLNDEYPNLVHAPEFLTAHNAVNDYLESKFAIIGGKISAYVREAERIIRIGQHSLNDVQLCSIEEAALAKYAVNSFLATKVVFMNELKLLADADHIDYKRVADLIVSDKRIGMTHMNVPGPDGYLGFGGACFPKDVSALLKYAESNRSLLSVIDAANKKNIMLRLTEPK